MDPDTSVITQSLLLDATPGSSSGFSDAPLAAGGSFTDGNVSIDVHSAGSGTASVDVLLGADTSAPSAPDPVQATPSADRVSLTWPASTDNVGVAGYRVYRDDSELATTTSPGYDDTDVSSGTTYSYRVEAFDVAGNATSSGTVSATMPAAPTEPSPTDPPPSDPPPPVIVDPPLPPADTSPPVVRIVAPGHSARVRRRAVVRARASDTTGVVRTQVWVDGKLRDTVKSAHVSWRWSLRHARPGRHLIIVRAFDAAGNHGSASVRVRVVRRRAS
jgi:hypothetical protein